MSEPRAALIGRARLLDSLERALCDGKTVLLYGPVGAGKTAIVHALGERVRMLGVPCALAPRTGALADFTLALANAYPGADVAGRSQREVRSRLLREVEARPPVILLDHVTTRGVALKASLKTLRGTGAGVLVAADVEHDRDHQRIRELRLTHVEVPVPRLHGLSMRAVFRAAMAGTPPCAPLDAAACAALVAAADGLPGRAIRFAARLATREAWSSGRPRIDWLRSLAAIAAAERYRTPLAGET